jgi:hypothetical protein
MTRHGLAIIAIIVLLVITGMFYAYLGLRLQTVHDFAARIEANQAGIMESIDRNDRHLAVQDAHLERQDAALAEIRGVIVGRE